MKTTVKKYKIFIYSTVVMLIIANIIFFALPKTLSSEKFDPVFIIYTQTENKELEKLFFKIQNIETSENASYMYLDKKHPKYNDYQKRFNLTTIDSAFIVMNRLQEAQGIKTPCPDYNFIKDIIQKYK